MQVTKNYKRTKRFRTKEINQRKNASSKLHPYSKNKQQLFNTPSNKQTHKSHSKFAKKPSYLIINCKRTKVTLKRLLKINRQKLMKKNKYLKFYLISRNYLRKMSAQTAIEIKDHHENTRKISWAENNEVLIFQDDKPIQEIQQSPIILELLNQQQI